MAFSVWMIDIAQRRSGLHILFSLHSLELLLLVFPWATLSQQPPFMCVFHVIQTPVMGSAFSTTNCRKRV